MTNATEQKVGLLNKGKRTIFGKHKDGRKFSLPPTQVGSFHPEIAARLRRLYPREILSIDDMQKQFEQANVQENTGAGNAPAPQAQETAAETAEAAADHKTVSQIADELASISKTPADPATPAKPGILSRLMGKPDTQADADAAPADKADGAGNADADQGNAA